MRDESMVVPMSKAERKRALADEHNRKYAAGELEKKDDVISFVKAITEGFQSVVQPK